MRRFVLCLVVAAFSALVPGSASAAQPVMTNYTQDYASPITDVCAAAIGFSTHLVITETDYFDANGAPTRQYIHTVERDTFTGPARSLTTDPYTYGVWFRLDASGNIVSGSAAGVTVRIHLPDGSLFLSAGLIILHPNEPVFIFGPDFGRSGNLGAFCSALGA